MGFFAESTLRKIKKPKALVAKCGLCQLYKHCKSPKMKVFGEGLKRILIVGEAPGETEDDTGKPFRGKSGKYLRNRLKEIGIKMDRDCWMTNALICRPEGNKTPTSEQIEWCNPNLRKVISTLKPIAILTVGKAAIESVLTGIWRKDLGAVSRWAGFKIPCRDLNTWIIPTFHPSYILRELKIAKGETPIEAIYGHHLSLLKGITKRPFKKVEDLSKQIEILYDEDKIIKALNWMRKHPAPISPDYETNMLKPDSPKSEIRAASVCWNGERTIAFPYEGQKVKRAWRRLMYSDCPKYGQNFKFEDRWTHDPIPNWQWDTMNIFHIIDNRKQACSLDFQAFVLLGLGTYSDHISPFFKAEDSYEENRIKDIDLGELLLYNGLDALTTFLIAKMQRKYLEVE